LIHFLQEIILRKNHNPMFTFASGIGLIKKCAIIRGTK